MDLLSKVLEWEGWRGREHALLLQVHKGRFAALGSGFASHGLWRSLKVDLAVFNHQVIRKLSHGLNVSFRDLTQEIGPTHPATVPPM